MTVREQIRLALVLNGGVSLAVWMGGVTHEIDLLLRAAQGDDDSLEHSDRAVFELWKSLVHGKKDLVVDVIAGTSAGGLNGTLLAAAIGSGAPLPALKETWETSAALTRNSLLRKPPANSMLDGDFLEETISKILRGVATHANRKAPRPVTLFITATAIGGLPVQFTDGFGGDFDVSDHRRVYRFQYDPHAIRYERDGRDDWKIIQNGDSGSLRNDFVDAADAMALAARASAGFPLAFVPVDESKLLEYRVYPDPYKRGPVRASCIIDGGVLNNAPFGPVLDAIAERRVDRWVRRVIVYIVPSSGQSREEGGSSPYSETKWSTVANSALRYPSEADFRVSTESLSAHMRTNSENHLHKLFERQLTGRSDAHHLQEAARKLFEDYRRSRAVAVVQKARQLRGEASGVTSLINGPADDSDAILQSKPLWVPSTVDELDTSDYEQWPWGTTPTERLIWTLVNSLERNLREHSARATSCAESSSHALSSALEKLSNCARVVRAVQDSVDTQLRRLETSSREETGVSGEPIARLNSALKNLDVRRVVGEQMRNAVNEYAMALHSMRHQGDAEEDLQDPEGSATAEEVLKALLAAEVLSQSFAPAEELGKHNPNFEFLRLGPDSHSPVFPQDTYAPLGDRKLYGTRLGHFGAFADADWRSSDFTWGRLDAAHHLLRLFIDDPADRWDFERRLHEAILQNDRDVMEARLQELAAHDDAMLFGKGHGATAQRVAAAVLRVLLGSGSPVGGKWRGWRTVLWGSLLGAGKEDRAHLGHWLRPSRWLATPGRLFWWWRLKRRPATALRAILPTTQITAVTLAAVVTAIAYVYVALTTDWGWSWFTLRLAATAGLGAPLTLFLLVWLESRLSRLGWESRIRPWWNARVKSRTKIRSGNQRDEGR